MKLLSTLILGTTLLTTPVLAGNHGHDHGATTDQTAPSIEVIKDNIYMIKGVNAGNVTVSIGEQGVFMIDDSLDGEQENVEAAIASITDQDIDFILNTHFHFDHTGTNVYFGEQGATIMAHDSVRERLREKQIIDFFNAELPPMAEAGLPILTFNSEMNFHYNGNHMHVMHVPNAHTDGDMIIHITDKNIIVAADLVFNGLYPFIDVENGGSVQGVMDGVKKMLDMADNNTIIISGHGPVMNKGDLQNYYEMLLTIASDIKSLIAEGKSKDEIIAAKPTKRYDDDINTAFISGDAFTEILYNDLSR